MAKKNSSPKSCCGNSAPKDCKKSISAQLFELLIFSLMAIPGMIILLFIVPFKRDFIKYVIFIEATLEVMAVKAWNSLFPSFPENDQP